MTSKYNLSLWFIKLFLTANYLFQIHHTIYDSKLCYFSSVTKRLLMIQRITRESKYLSLFLTVNKSRLGHTLYSCSSLFARPVNVSMDVIKLFSYPSRLGYQTIVKFSLKFINSELVQKK